MGYIFKFEWKLNHWTISSNIDLLDEVVDYVEILKTSSYISKIFLEEKDFLSNKSFSAIHVVFNH